jgi:hypothetical protein
MIAQKPTKQITKFSIVILLILQGFTEIIAIRLPQTNGKRTSRN